MKAYEPPQELFNTEQAARYMGFSPATLRRWRARREGPPWSRFDLTSRSIRYAKRDLETWIAGKSRGQAGLRGDKAVRFRSIGGNGIVAVVASTAASGTTLEGPAAAHMRLNPWPSTGFVGLRQIVGRHGGPIPLSPSKWWAGVRAGEFPKPLKLGGRTVWRVSDIDAFIARTSETSRSLK